jgi:hypothetical protein
MRWLAHWVASVDLVEAEKLIFGECPATMNEEEEEQWPTNSVGQKTVPTLLEWAKRVVDEGGGGGDEEFSGNGQKQCLGHFGPIRDSAEARRSTKWAYWTIWGLCWWWWIGQRRMANLWIISGTFYFWNLCKLFRWLNKFLLQFLLKIYFIA